VNCKQLETGGLCLENRVPGEVRDCRQIAEIRERLAADGIVLVDGLVDSGAVAELGKALGDTFHHRDSEASGITRIRSRGDCHGTDLQGFSDHELLPHTDRSPAEEPPDYVLMAAVVQPSEGGDSIFVDGKQLFAWLSANDPALLANLTRPQSAIFSDGDGFHRGAMFERYSDGSYLLRFRADDLGYFAMPIATRVRSLMAGIDACAIRTRLNPGQGVVVNNYRWLHGRTSFSGEREILRLLIKRGPAMAEISRFRGFYPDGCLS
jgi:alpha-ketoglutarate-dependent taurine dioxygenase